MTTFVGVGLALAGNIIQSFGFIAQKVGHNKNNEINQQVATIETTNKSADINKPATDNKSEQKSVLTQWIWWVGIIAYTIGGAMNSISLNYAALSIIAPLTSVKLSSMAILSHFILKEKLSMKDVVAIFMIIIGVVLVVSFGPASDPNVTSAELREYFQGIPYIITVSMHVAITIGVFIAVKYFERKNFKSDNNIDISYGKNILLFGYVWIGVFFSSNNNLFIKSAVAILASTSISSQDAKSNWTDFVTYFIFVLAISCMFLMEYWRQKALSHFGALYVVPTFAVTSIIITSVIGMIFFEEYDSFTVLSASMLILGIIITVIGVLVLTVDVAKLWTELYDEHIKVALIKYEMAQNKYPQTIYDLNGGPVCEYYQNYFYKRPAVFVNLKSNPVNTQSNSEL
eukprot:509187_1